MTVVNIHEAKTQLSRLIERAMAGEPLVIAKAGKPLVKLVRLGAPNGNEAQRFGFLQGAMQTAAGVVAGEMAFRALEDVFSSGHERGFTGGETINNYYENSGDRDSGAGGFGDRLAQADGYDGNISSDIEDRRGESHGFFDGGDNSDSNAFADDNSSYDDSGSYEDGGSDFGGNDDSGF